MPKSLITPGSGPVRTELQDELAFDLGKKECELCERSTFCTERYSMVVCKTCADELLP